MSVQGAQLQALLICFFSLGEQIFQPKTGVRTAASEVRQQELSHGLRYLKERKY